jgi:hypothetical protein
MTTKFFGVNEHGRFDKNLAQAQFHTHVQNILKKHDEATKELKEGGSKWYEKAHEEAKKVGSGDVRKGAGIIAALSPLTDWDRNVQQAHEMKKTGYVSNALIPQNVEKAHRIMAGEDPHEVLGGHKVRSFFENIHDPSNPEHVTVDRHAYDIAMGHPFVGTGRKTTPRGGGGKMSPDIGLSALGRYQHFVQAYKHASQELGEPVPNKTQAISWVAHRGAL